MRRCFEATMDDDDAQAAVVYSTLAKTGIYDGLAAEADVTVMRFQCCHHLSILRTLSDEDLLGWSAKYERTDYCLFGLIQLLSRPSREMVGGNDFDSCRMHYSMHQYIQSLLALAVSMLAVQVVIGRVALLPTWPPTNKKKFSLSRHHHHSL